jgi:hypothetical protein
MNDAIEVEHDLHVFMAQVSDRIASEYDRIYARASEDAGTAGDEGEKNWANLLRDWLPAGYHVATKGRLIGHDGTMSPQIDVVVLKPSYPKKLLEGQIWLASGVAAAFECKTTLTARHVRESVDRAKAFKALFGERTGNPRVELSSPLIYGLLAHSHSWKGKRSDPIGNIQQALEDANQEVDHPRFEMDLLCVADLAAWHRFTMVRYEASWAPLTSDRNREIFGGNWGPMTSFLCADAAAENQSKTFKPVGAFVGTLTQSLAWSDPPLRDIADYYRRANLLGQGSGHMRPWPVAVLSDATRLRIDQGGLSNGVSWDEWAISGF